MRSPFLMSAAVALAISSVPAQLATDGVELQRGIDLMETRGDCPAAAEIFRRVARSRDRGVASRALLHLAGCLELTQSGDPVPVYRRIVREFSDQGEVKRLAEARLRILEPPRAQTPDPSAVLQGPSAFSVIGRISTGAEPYAAISSLDGSRIFVTNLSDPSVAVVDADSNSVVKTFSLERPPRLAALSSDGLYLLLAYPGSIVALDVESGDLKSFRVDAEGIYDIAPVPGGGAYLAAGRSGLKRLDLSTGEVRTVRADPCPMFLALSPDQSRLWVNYQCGGPGGRPGHDVIAELDSQSGRLLNTISELPNVGGVIQVSPDGRLVMAHAGDACSHPNYDHVGCEETGVSIARVFRADTRALVKSMIFSFVTGPDYISFVPQRPLVTLAIGGTLSFVETQSFSLVSSLPLVTSGRHAYSANGDRAFVPLPSDDVVAVVWLGPTEKD